MRRGKTNHEIQAAIRSQGRRNGHDVHDRYGLSAHHILHGFDQHMNLLLDDSVEIVEGKSSDLGTIVVRGDNVVIISPPPPL